MLCKMTTLLALALLIAIQGVLCASSPCSGDIKVKTRDGQSCYVCGRSRITTPTEQWATMGKHVASLGDFPWSAALFMQGINGWEQFCGGTLVTPQAVLTAAHCVTTPNEDYQADNPSNIRVVLGNVHRSWDITEPTEIKRKVKEVRAHPDYKGLSLRYANDIALLILESEVPTSSAVMPACLDYSLNQLPPYNCDIIGYMCGFSYTQECSPLCPDRTERLMYTSNKVLTFNRCFNSSEFLHADPMWLVPQDKMFTENSTVAPIHRKDGGAGVTLISQGLHWIMGVASARETIGVGDPTNFLITLTNVSQHMEWLKNNLPEY